MINVICTVFRLCIYFKIFLSHTMYGSVLKEHIKDESA
jgi:hypothetical protein